MLDEASKLHCVFDLESLGTREDSVLLSCACIPYHLERDANKSIEELVNGENTFYVKLDVADQVRAGRVIDTSTLDWWSTQGESAQEILRPTSKDLTMRQFFEAFKTWQMKSHYNPKKGLAWQRGTIDIAWLDSMWRMLGIDQDNRPILWHKVRDIRTAVDVLTPTAKLNGLPDGFQESLDAIFPGKIDHNALHDVGAQILQLRMCGAF